MCISEVVSAISRNLHESVLEVFILGCRVPRMVLTLRMRDSL
ncbi:MAG: hypothetical protein ABDK94_06675 [Atribacterota bacterium]